MAKLLSVAEAVSQASMEIGITQRPVSQAVNSPDQDIAMMTALMSAVADEVLDEEPYKEQLGDGNWLLSSDGSTSNKPTADSDKILFDGRLMVAGLKFRFLAAKGLEFAEPLRDFATRMNKLAGRANTRVLDLYDEGYGGRIQ
jgi:hypothetical protein